MSASSDDPVLQSSRREAIVVCIAWLSAMLYTVTYCYRFGYGREVADLKFVLGFPDWIFWGIVTPWTVCIAFSFLFGALCMRDEDLGEDTEGADEFGEKEAEHA